MTRHEATRIIYQLINSGILDTDLENSLTDICSHICSDDFAPCSMDDKDSCECDEYCKVDKELNV